MKRILFLAAALFVAVSCTDDSTSDNVVDDSATLVEISLSIAAPEIETRADMSLDGDALTVAWSSSELLGLYSIADNTVDNLTLSSSSNTFKGRTYATEARVVYPSDASINSGSYSVDLSSQTADTSSPVTQVNSAMVMVSSEVIEIADATTVEMTYALSAMKFDFTFTGVDPSSTYTINSLTINDVPVTASIDLSADAVSISSSSTGAMVITLSNAPKLAPDSFYDAELSVMTTMIPFERAASEELKFTLGLTVVDAAGTSAAAEYSAVVTPEAALSYTTGGFYTVAAECPIGDIVYVVLATNDNYYYYNNVFIEGRSADGGDGVAFFDCETGVLYDECAVEALGATAGDYIDFYGYANSDYFSVANPAGATGKLKNYKCNDVNIATGSEATYTDVEASLYGVVTKFRVLDPDDATHAAIIAAYEDGTILFTANTFAGITDPGASTPYITPTLDAYDAMKFSIDKYQYGYVRNSTTGKNGIIKYTAISDATSGKYINATFDLIWEKVSSVNDNYYKYSDVFIEGRSADGGDGVAFFDCETGVLYDECAVEALGSEAGDYIDFYGYANSDYFSVANPAGATGKLKNYKCNDVAIATGTESTYTDVEASLYGVVTKFRVLDPDDATHAAIIAAYEDGTFLFTDTAFDGITDPGASTPYITPTLDAYDAMKFSIDKYQYGYVMNSTSGKRGIIKYTAVSDLDATSGKYVNATFDLLWEK